MGKKIETAKKAAKVLVSIATVITTVSSALGQNKK